MTHTIQVCSDLHLDYQDINETNFSQIIIKSAEILVLAGDIGNPFTKVFYEFIKYCSELFQVVLFVSGNHESYGYTIDDSITHLSTLLSMFNNVVFLNNSTYEIDDICFIGTTLWSHIPINVSKTEIYKINDFSKIKYHTIEEHNRYFYNNYKFINDTLFQYMETNKKCIVITHHSPSFATIPDKYIGSITNCCYATDLEHLFHYPNICVWIYGHLHDNRNLYKNSVILYSNCYRSKNYNNQGILEV